MASPPYRAKVHAPAMPSSASKKTNSSFNVPKNSNPKENNALDSSRSEVRASSRPSYTPAKAKPMKKSFMSPTFSAASKAKRVLSERNDYIPGGNSQLDRIPSREAANAVPAMMEDDINKGDNLGEAMEVDSVAERRQRPPFLEESQRQLEGKQEPPSLEELQRKVRRFLEENFPHRIRENAGHDNAPKDRISSPPYHPIHSPFSVRPDFVHVNGFPEGLLAPDRDSDMREGEKGPSLPPYDPKKNYLSPRPQFLRYKPNRCLDLVPSLGTEMDASGDGGKVEDGSIGSPDFTGAECEVVDEIESLERQIASVDLDTEEMHGDRNANEVCEDKKQGEARAEETRSGSCMSSESAMVQETVGPRGVCMFAPKFNINEEVEESKDEDDMDKPSLVDFWRSIFMVIFAVFAASVILLASGSSGLLPASLHDNTLANLWRSSKFYNPTMEALRGTEGFWRQDLVGPRHHGGVHLQQRDYSDLRMKASGFCTSAKEIASRAVENLKKFGGNFFSSSKIVEQPFLLEDSVFPIGDWEGNVPDILKEDHEASSLVPLSENGDGEDNSRDLIGLSPEDQIHGEADRLSGSVSPSESIEFEGSPEMQSSEETAEYGDGLENSVEPLILPSEGHIHGDADRVDGTMSPPASIDLESHPGMHSSYHVNLSSPQDTSYGGAEGLVEELSDTSIYIESENLDTSPVKNSDKIGISIDALDAPVPEDGIPELVPMGDSQTIHLESQPPVHGLESASSTETEIYGEPESSETFAMQNLETHPPVHGSESASSTATEIYGEHKSSETFVVQNLESQPPVHGFQSASSTETEIYGEPESSETFAMQNLDEIGRLSDGKVDSAPDLLDAKGIPEMVPKAEADAPNLNGFSQTIHLEPYTRVHSPYESVSSTEREIYGEPESFENFAMQNLEEMGISDNEEVVRGPFSMGDSEIALDTDIPNENEFTVSAESVMSQEQENRQGESELSSVKDLKPSEALTSSIPRKSARKVLLFGSMVASLLAAALAAIYLAYRSRKSPRNVDAEETLCPEAQEESNYPRGNDCLAPSRNVGFYPRGHYSSSTQMNMNMPDEKLRQWGASSVPRVQLLHEYSPARVNSNSENVSNPWAASVSEENRFQTPERRVRRKSSLFSATSTPEMSMDMSSYGSFTTYDKVSDEEQVRITPVRRSNRIRNQTNSPHSVRGKPAK